jgi:hypothetical protein
VDFDDFAGKIQLQVVRTPPDPLTGWGDASCVARAEVDEPLLSERR